MFELIILSEIREIEHRCTQLVFRQNNACITTFISYFRWDDILLISLITMISFSKMHVIISAICHFRLTEIYFLSSFWCRLQHQHIKSNKKIGRPKKSIQLCWMIYTPKKDGIFNYDNGVSVTSRPYFRCKSKPILICNKIL